MALLDVIQNLALIISLAMIYRVIMARLKINTVITQILIGLLFGAFTIAGMETPFVMMPGLFYDGRSIIISLAGLFCGPLTTLVAAAVSAAYRFSLGGSGMFVGISVIAESAAVGLTFYYLRRAKKIRVNFAVLTGLGLLVHFIMLLIMIALPNGMGLIVWRELGIIVLFFYTAATVVIGLLLLDSENQLLDRKALLENEKILEKAQQLARIGSWIWRREGNKLEGSDELYHILGLERDSFQGDLAEYLVNSIPPEDLEIEKQGWVDALNGDSLKRMEFRVAKKDGSISNVWAETGERILDNKGLLVSASGILQDITERRKAEKDLVDNESRYRSLIMNSPDAILVNHKDAFVMANRSAVELFGAKSEADLIGKTPWDLFHPDFHDQVRSRIHTLLDSNESIPISREKIIRLDGRVVDVDVVAATFTFNGVTDIHVIVRDVTQQKKMEDDLRASHDLLTRLTEQVPGAVIQFCLLPDGRRFFPFASPGIERIFGLLPEELKEDALSALKIIHPDDIPRVGEELRESARSMEVFNCEFRILVPNQGSRWFLCNAQPERLDGGGMVWSGIISDITDRKMDEQKIAEQLSELRRWQSVMIGREKRAIELKQEVNALLDEMNLAHRYSIEENPSSPEKSFAAAVHQKDIASARRQEDGEILEGEDRP